MGMYRSIFILSIGTRDFTRMFIDRRTHRFISPSYQPLLFIPCHFFGKKKKKKKKKQPTHPLHNMNYSTKSSQDKPALSPLDSELPVLDSYLGPKQPLSRWSQIR